MKSIPVSTVVYNPEQFVESNLLQIAKTGCDLIVFDNSPYSIESTDLKKKLESYTNLHYLSCGTNVGLSQALNRLINYSTSKSFPAILFLDQDTMITSKTLDYINSSYALWESVFFNFYALVTFTNRSSPYMNSLVDTTLTINSGSLLNVRTIETLGGFNQDLFVDLVDYELCFRALDHGFKIALCPNCPDLDHQSKQPDIRFSIFSKILPIRRYPSKRILSTVIAHMYLIKQHSLSNPLFLPIIVKSLFQYLLFQVISRMLPLRHLRAQHINE
jgi:rhamnosyltransferase